MGPLSIVLWIPALAVKLLLALVGVVIVPFTKPDNPIYGNNEHPTAPDWYREGQPEWWRDYVWRALRNPVNNIRYLIDEPDVAKGPNPDEVVRNGTKSASRWLRSGLFSEYWYMRRINWAIRGTWYKYFEFRIGWKFSGVPGFAPTIQLGPRSQ